MLAWKIYEGATPFSKNENAFIKRYLEILQKECPRDGAFLNQLDLPNIEFNWAPNMTLDNGILGAWAMTTPNKVFMAAYHDPQEGCIDEEGNPIDPNYNIYKPRKGSEIKDWEGLRNCEHISSDAMAMTVVHELVHKFQFQTSPILYCINRLVTLFVDHIPVLEEIGIEYDARKNSETPELMEFYNKIGTTFGLVAYAALQGKLDPKTNTKYRYLVEPMVDEETGEVYPIPYEKKYIDYGEELVKLFY